MTSMEQLLGSITLAVRWEQSRISVEVEATAMAPLAPETTNAIAVNATTMIVSKV